MNVWLIASGMLIVALLPCAIVAFRAAPMDRLIALQLAGTITTLLVHTLAEGFGRPSILDLALALAVLSVPGTLVYAHFLERWL